MPHPLPKPTYLVGHAGLEDIQRPVDRGLDERVFIRLRNAEDKGGCNVADVRAAVNRRRPRLGLEKIGLHKLQTLTGINEALFGCRVAMSSTERALIGHFRLFKLGLG